MKKLYRNILMASAIGAFTAGCGGDYKPDLNPGDLEDAQNPEFKPLLIQDVAYLFGDIFKQLVSALDVSSSTTSMFNGSTTMGAIVNDAITQAAGPSVASGISLVTDANCSKAGALKLGAHFEDEDKQTPDTADIINSFSSKTIETSIKANFEACEEWGRNPGKVDKTNPDARFDKTKETLLNGVMNISFISYPNTAKDGFSLDANVTLDNFEMIEKGGDLSDKGTIRFDGEFDVSLKSTDTTNAQNIQFLTNIGAAYVNSRAAEYEHIKIDANGQLNTNSDFDKFSYNLDFKGATSNYEIAKNATFEYFTTSNLTKATLSSGFAPEGGELMIITPDGDAGTAEVKVLPDDSVVVEINFDGQTTSCSFGELIAGSDKCGKPTN